MQIEAILSAAGVSPRWSAFIVKAGGAPLGSSTLLPKLASWSKSGLQLTPESTPIAVAVATIAYARAALEAATDEYARGKTAARLELQRAERALDASPVLGVPQRAELEAAVDAATAALHVFCNAGVRYADVARHWEGLDASGFDAALLEHRVEPLADSNWSKLVDELVASSALAGAGRPRARARGEG